MPISLLATIFVTVFLAELGDKTQLATVLFASKEEASPWHVFLAAAAALVASTALAVFLGSAFASRLDPRVLSYIAGVGFIAIGIWTLVTA